ncbi:LPS-assembly protein LptD [Aureimonas fodinaquatilis]|uniref:LPS-assembly protein LptD n=1 Tax=Aureimonas fodinaquatilis TaxID=2565783 RepID=A0A5B0DWG8_9HYPH|nr:LPS-assembly protein LptD [Aureimonas fodinaquatilis]KAA0970215.1 LPS-assembly protein LptD [Aureimonas fodinaquatilis]
MIARGTSRRSSARRQLFVKGALLAGVALGALVGQGDAGYAQESLESLGANVNIEAGEQLFLEADTVSYDSESATVTASGGVQIDYGQYKLVAREIVYDQNLKRLVAVGDVELLEPGGNKVYADAIDVTDDFADGFIEALRIETPDNTRLAAAEAVRESGSVTTFERGVYTACEACEANPDRPPLWQVKARRIVWDQKNQIIRYYGARFELYGLPLAYLPYFASPDPTVKRRSGFLAPEFRQSDETGFGLRVPYFLAISDSSDATVAGTYYSRQGFLGEVEYRKAFGNGYFTLQAAGISQNNPDRFDDFWSDGITSFEDVPGKTRGMIGTTGRFALNEQWTFGWDVLAQSDPNFSNAYEIDNFSDIYRSSEIYLTGLGSQSFFDLRAQKFDVQTLNTFNEEVQPYILPSLDYQYIAEQKILGGQVQLDANITNIRRDNTFPASLLICEEPFYDEGRCTGSGVFPYRTDTFRQNTLEGDYARATVETSWKSEYITDGGLVLTPSVAGRGDLYTAKMESPGYDYGSLYSDLGAISINETGARGMATAAIEARYPYLIETANTSHVFEPIAQLLIRPDEMDAGKLPNEDSQTLVFNSTNLFSHDKFTGYDRMEGGTRANVGIQYSGVLGGRYFLNAIAGQSYQLAGKNPFAADDLSLVGYDSGLETDRSDYVSGVALTLPVGVTLSAQGRFDESNFDLRRADLSSSFAAGRFSGSVTYSQIAAQPIYGLPVDRQQVQTNASVRLTDTLLAFGSVGYDIENDSIISKSFGVGYADECFSLIATYQSTNDRYQLASSESTVMVRLSLRTLVETDFNYNLGND